jgi:triacylglycerol lipase
MRKFLFLGVLTLLLFSCKKETSGELAIPTPVPSGKDPIIFVHGFLASGDTYEKQVKRFTSNGYSLADLYAFDWNSLGDRSVINRNLNTLVDSVLARTGKSKVHLVGP